MNAPVDFNAIKSRQMTAWASGDYAVIGTTLQLVGIPALVVLLLLAVLVALVVAAVRQFGSGRRTR